MSGRSATTNQLDMLHRSPSTAALLLAASLLAACETETAPQLPPPLVTVTQPVVRDVTRDQVFVGVTHPAKTAEVRARVRGFLRSIEFEVGSRVEAGDVLFTIEPQEFEARVAQAQAALAGAEAELQRAQADFERIDSLQRQGDNRAVSESQVDLARAERDKADANIASARASLAEAELNLSYTQVSSPLTGRVGRNLVDIGNLVGAGESTLLTTVVELDPVHVYFDISERTFTNYLRMYSARPANDAEEKERHPVFVALEGDEGFPHAGWVDFINNTAQADTGTIQVRAVVPNPDFRLYPGLFARVRVPEEESAGAVLVEARAIGADLGGKYVLVVGQGNVVERRSVVLGPQQGELRVIESGLDPEATYIVDGVVRARPGMPVRVQTLEQAAAKQATPKQTPQKPTAPQDDAPAADERD